MQTISIDAGVLALPAAIEASELYDYVDSLLDWQKLLEEPWVSVRISERASQLLLEESLYPLRNALRDAFQKNGITEYDANTVVQVTDRLLRLTPSFEAYFKVKDVLLDRFDTAPPLLSLTINRRMASDLGRCVVLIALLRKHCRAVKDNVQIVVRHAPKSGRVSVKAEIHDLEHARDDVEELPTPPALFEGEVLVCRDFLGLLTTVNPESVWVTSVDDDGKTLAIRLAVFAARLNRGGDPNWDGDLSVRYGPAFFESADQVIRGASADILKKLLRCISETIDGENMAATHALRTGSSGGAPQRVRSSDSAKAWRRDIDYEYHLHYWSCPDGFVELASVGPHNEFGIPE